MLIDGGTEKGAELVADNIRQLGFRLADVKFLLISHEHIDHVGGIARLQQLTGATLVASAPAEKVLNTRRARAPTIRRPGCTSPSPPHRSAGSSPMASDVRLGNLRLFAMTTPGHTPGR